MAGISDKALNGIYSENKYRFGGKELQNKEFSDGSGIEWYAYGMREQDPQLGRFFRIDPVSEKFYFLTPFQYASNDPIKNLDIDGLEGISYEYFLPLIINTAKDQNSASAKVLGAVSGVGQALGSTIQGLFDMVRHPINTIVGIGKLSTIQGQLEVGQNLDQLYDETATQFRNGTSFDRWFIGGEIAGHVGLAFIGTKGLNAFLEAGKSVWTLSQFERGFAIEKILGANLPRSFPVIDRFANGIATSIKSIDLGAKSYNGGNGLLNTLKGYLNKLDNFSGGTLEGVQIKGTDISSKVLQVAIEPGKASVEQWEQISQAFEYGKRQNIALKLSFVK